MVPYQLSASLPNYAPTIYTLEQAVAGRKSAEKLVGLDGASDQKDSLTKGIPETREGAGRGGTDPKIYPSS